jgi:hypothetical protein|tara:strand:- start:3955 stop:4083 length:129 start_codon:yes stop_codon:yes gene_type:complete
MKGLKRKIKTELVKRNLAPIKTVILQTGLVCCYYQNGLIKVL